MNNIKRTRGRNFRGGGSGGGPPPIRQQGGGMPLNRNHVFDSSGPDIRVRGTAQQLFEKYLQLGRDATSSGDRVQAEGYFQHAEHYFRIVGAINAAQGQQQGGGQANGQPNGQYAGQGAPNGNAQYNGPANGQQSSGYPQGRRFDRQDGEDQAADSDETPGMGEQPAAEVRSVPINGGTPPSEET